MEKAKAWLAWSTGKDAAWALHAVGEAGEVEVRALLTTLTADYDRVSMHSTRRRLLEIQAESAGLEVRIAEIPAECTNEIYEEVMRKMVERARSEGVSRMIFGDIFLEDVRRYREEKLAGTLIEPSFPLWGTDTRELAGEMIDAGVKAVVTCVDPRKVPAEMCGRTWDESFLADLPAEADPCGENGEFHTFAFAGPAFREEIAVRVGETVERGGFVFADVLPL